MTQPLNHTSPEDVPREVVKVRKKSVLREYTEAILVAVLLALLIRTFVVQAFKIPSGSMIPTLLVGDHILVNKFVYRFTAPKRGDVIVFKYPVDESRDFIKRIIAVGGEDLHIKDQKIYVNCKPPEPSCRPIDDPWGKWEDRFGISESTSVQGAAGLLLRDGRQPEQQPGQPLLGVRQARQDQGAGLPHLLVLGLGRRTPFRSASGGAGWASSSTSGPGARPLPGAPSSRRAPPAIGSASTSTAPTAGRSARTATSTSRSTARTALAPFVAGLRAELAALRGAALGGPGAGGEPVPRRRHAVPPAARGRRGRGGRRPARARARAGRRGHARGQPRGARPGPSARVPRRRGDAPVARRPVASTTRSSGASGARTPRPTRPTPTGRRARRGSRTSASTSSTRAPARTWPTWARTLDEALAWAPDHLSAYALTLEPATPFGRRPPAGIPDEDLQVAQFDALVERAAAAGLERYEISNFAQARPALPSQPRLLAPGGLRRSGPGRPRGLRRAPLLDAALRAPLAGRGARGRAGASRAGSGCPRAR